MRLIAVDTARLSLPAWNIRTFRVEQPLAVCAAFRESAERLVDALRGAASSPIGPAMSFGAPQPS